MLIFMGLIYFFSLIWEFDIDFLVFGFGGFYPQKKISEEVLMPIDAIIFWVFVSIGFYFIIFFGVFLRKFKIKMRAK